MKDEKYLWRTEIIRDQSIIIKIISSLLLFLQLPLTQISLLKKKKWEKEEKFSSGKVFTY